MLVVPDVEDLAPDRHRSSRPLSNCLSKMIDEQDMRRGFDGLSRTRRLLVKMEPCIPDKFPIAFIYYTDLQR
jgi:hypothetical protein